MIYEKLVEKVFNVLKNKFEDVKIDENKITLEFQHFRSPNTELKRFENIIVMDLKYSDKVFTNKREFSDETIEKNPELIVNILESHLKYFIKDIPLG